MMFSDVDVDDDDDDDVDVDVDVEVDVDMPTTFHKHPSSNRLASEGLKSQKMDGDLTYANTKSQN